MSRIVTIQSELIEEADLAQEVIDEMNIHSLTYHQQKKCFENRQYDDVQDGTLAKATQIYFSKRKERNLKKVQDALKKAGYKPTVTTENNKTKIIAVQRVYA